MYSYRACCSFTPNRFKSKFTNPSFLHKFYTKRLLLLGHRRLERLDRFEVGLSIDELLDLLDLQLPIFAGDDGGDGDRFAVQFDPE